MEPSQASAPAVQPSESPLNLIGLALSVGLIVLAALTLAQFPAVVIPLTVVCLTLSILGAATKHPYALLGWVATGLSAIALAIAVIAVATA